MKTTKNMKYKEFVKQIWDAVEECPDNWRKGQKVFNVMETLYGDVARQVQFINKVDCFYDDKQIEPFIDQCWIRVFSKEHPIPPREEESVDFDEAAAKYIESQTPADQGEEMTIYNAFKAGAEWHARQGQIFESVVWQDSDDKLFVEAFVDENKFKMADGVVIQVIRKTI